MKGVKRMDELVELNPENKLIRFCLSPSDEGCYIVDNLEINKHLHGFVVKKQIDGSIYELSVYKDVFCVTQIDSMAIDLSLISA